MGTVACIAVILILLFDVVLYLAMSAIFGEVGSNVAVLIIIFKWIAILLDGKWSPPSEKK